MIFNFCDYPNYVNKLVLRLWFWDSLHDGPGQILIYALDILNTLLLRKRAYESKISPIMTLFPRA